MIALAQIDPDSAAVRAALKRAADTDEDENVRWWARESLGGAEVPLAPSP